MHEHKATNTLAWRAALVLIGASLIKQVFELGQNLRLNWIYGLLFAVNLFLFFFIFDQLAWKVKLPEMPNLKPKPDPEPVPIKAIESAEIASSPVQTVQPTPLPLPVVETREVHLPIAIEFEGLGRWAQLVGLSEDEFCFRAQGLNVPEMIGKEIELEFSPELLIRVTFEKKVANNYFFKPNKLAPAQWDKIRAWVEQQLSAQKYQAQVS